MRVFAPALCLCLLAGAARADYAESLAVAPGGTLEVDVDLGEGLRPDPGFLRVLSHDRDEVRVEAAGSGWGEWRIRYELRAEESRVRFVAAVEGSFSWLFGGPRLEVRVFVPREFSLDARLSAGPIRIEEVGGEVRARARDGSIELVSVDGDVRLRTSGGSVLVREVHGNVEVRAANGDVEATWVEGDLDIRTGGGEVDVRNVQGRVSVVTDRGAMALRDLGGPVEARTERGAVFASFVHAPSGFLETRRGPVEVLVPNGHGLALEARSARGEVEIGSGLAWDGDRGEGHALGKINGGGPPLRLYTARGQVRVHAR